MKSFEHLQSLWNYWIKTDRMQHHFWFADAALDYGYSLQVINTFLVRTIRGINSVGE